MKSLSPRVGVLLVFALQMALGWLFSVVQPLGRTPDEIAHVQYVAFLAQEVRLPFFESEGGGEAGYQAQHPPLYYAAGALIYRLSAGLDEALRWHLLRWATLLFVGGGLFYASRRFFQTLWPAHPPRALAATASVVWMPLALLYVGYVNPDGLVAMWGAFTLWFCARAWRSNGHGSEDSTRRNVFSRRDAVLLGAWCGLALLTKLSGLPLLIIALWTLWKSPVSPKKLHFALCLGTTAVLTVPWYARNWWLYGSPFVHTLGKYGTGFENGAQNGFGTFAWLTWRETFLSTWAQRGWFPDGFWSFLFYGLIIASVVVALVLLTLRGRAQEPTTRAILSTGALLIVLIFAGQQWAFWTQDVEFNAGGRYLLAGLPAIVALLFAGWFLAPRVGKVWSAVWLLALILMNVVSAQHIVDVLNPRYAPGWKMFEFPPGEKRTFRF